LSAFQAGYANKRPVSLLDNKPLRLLLHNIVDLQRIDRNIQGGYLSSVSVTASSYNTGDSITFFRAMKPASGAEPNAVAKKPYWVFIIY